MTRRDADRREVADAADGTTVAEVTEPVAVVEAFLAALERLDIDGALALVAPDIVYQNVPLPPARGIGEFARQMRFLERYCTGFEASIHTIAADDGSVLTERTDVLERGAFRAGFWVCGTFEVADGRITEWRDYFDWATVAWAVVSGAVRAVVASSSARR